MVAMVVVWLWRHGGGVVVAALGVITATATVALDVVVVKSSNHERLSIRIPDTIVVASPAGPAVWYYTDAEGRIRATKRFSKSSVIKSFGASRPDNRETHLNRQHPCCRCHILS